MAIGEYDINNGYTLLVRYESGLVRVFGPYDTIPAAWFDACTYWFGVAPKKSKSGHILLECWNEVEPVPGATYGPAEWEDVADPWKVTGYSIGVIESYR